MKRKFYLVLTLALVLLTTSCVYYGGYHGGYGDQDEGVEGNGILETRSFDLEDFSELDLGGSLPVKVLQGEEFKVEVTTDTNIFELLELRVSGDELILRQEDDIVEDDEYLITITMPKITKIHLSGLVSASLANFKERDPLEIDLSGLGSLKADVHDRKLIEIDMSGLGNISLIGSCDKLVCDCSGIGSFKGLDCICKVGEVNCSGLGGVSLNATEELAASVSGLGGVRYKGNPRIKDLSISGMGGIKKLD